MKGKYVAKKSSMGRKIRDENQEAKKKKKNHAKRNKGSEQQAKN